MCSPELSTNRRDCRLNLRTLGLSLRDSVATAWDFFLVRYSFSWLEKYGLAGQLCTLCGTGRKIGGEEGRWPFESNGKCGRSGAATKFFFGEEGG